MAVDLRSSSVVKILSRDASASALTKPVLACVMSSCLHKSLCVTRLLSRQPLQAAEMSGLSAYLIVLVGMFGAVFHRRLSIHFWRLQIWWLYTLVGRCSKLTHQN